MQEFVKNFLSIGSGEVKRTLDDNLLHYSTGTLTTEISFSQPDADSQHIQAKTKWFELEFEDHELIMRVCHQLSIYVGFTIAFDRDEKAIYSLNSVAYKSGATENQADFEVAKLRVFLLLTIQNNSISNQLFRRLADQFNVDLSETLEKETTHGYYFPQSITHRVNSPDLLLELSEIQTELETEISYLTGRMNYTQIFDETEDQIRKPYEFGYGEEEGDQGPSIVSSFHVSYIGRSSFGDAKPLHAGIVIDRASEASIGELTQLAWDHFANPALSLLGYYYPGSGLAGCYVTRLPSFFVEVLSNEIPGFTEPENLRKFEIGWCMDSFKNYRRLENLSRSNNPSETSAQIQAKEIADSIYDKWRLRAYSWPTNPTGAQWPLTEQYAFADSSIRRLANLYLAVEYVEGETEYGLAKLTMDTKKNNASAIISLSVFMPNGTSDFTSPAFEVTIENFKFHFGTMISILARYYLLLDFELIEFFEEEADVMNNEIQQLANFDKSQISQAEEVSLDEIRNFVASSWDAATDSEEAFKPARLIIDKTSKKSWPRSFHIA